MTSRLRGRLPRTENDTRHRSMRPARASAVALVAVIIALGAFPGAADAHGPIAPVASSYLARVTRAPAGVEAKVIDGDQRMWVRVAPSETVEVVDYRGAPYLRFSRAGVAVNHSSALYYLNESPVAGVPPPGLTTTTPPSWQRVSAGHDYEWHDGRLHALATVAAAPGAAYLGRWTIPVVVDGSPSSISGGLWHAPTPSLVWLWPIAVILLCVVAAWRTRRPRLDRVVQRGLAVAALGAISVAALGLGLHGRPAVSVFQLAELGLVLVFVGWRLYRLAFGQPGHFSYFAIAFVALWEGAQLAPTLLNGFVLLATPAFLTRAAAVLCFGCGFGLLVLASRIADHEVAPSSRGDADDLSESLV